jgi:uncharacterized membrane protein SpoIIM required for sporulation
MNYRQQREQDWVELAELLERLDGQRGKPASAEQAQRLGVLYRRTTSHLSLIRSNPMDRRLEAKVQQLVVRAHGYVYRPRPGNFLKRLRRFFSFDFPSSVLLHGNEILIALLVFVLGGIIGLGATYFDPDLYYAMVPLEEARSPTAAVEFLEDSLVSGRDSGAGGKTVFAGFLWQHNVKVGLLSFALGAAAGIPTILLLLYNGMMIGAMSAVFLKADLGLSWFAWLAGHGVTEIMALLFAGAGGLVLGRAVLWPGPRSRRQALQEASKRCINLVMGTVLMLFIAALLESFFRQSQASMPTRYVVALMTGILWLLYFRLLGRPRAAPSPSGADNC